MHRRFALPSLFAPRVRRRLFQPFGVPGVFCEEPDGGGGGGGGDGKGKKKDKRKALKDLIAEDDELQDEINDLIERRLARDRRGRQSGSHDDKGLSEELETLRAEKAERERGDAEKQKEYEKALGLEREKFTKKELAAKKREETLINELRRDRVRSQLVAELARQNANDPEAYADILEKRIKFDAETFRTHVIDDRDPEKEATDKEGEPLTIKALVSGWISERAWAAKAAEGEGAGAKGGDGDGKQKGKAKGKPGDIASLEKAVEDAIAKAEKNPSTGNITAVSKAKKALKDAQAKAA